MSRIVTPKVYLLAESQLHCGEGGVHEWLADLDGSEVLDHLIGTGAEQLIELAARRCYKSFKPGLNPNVTKVRTSSQEFHHNILKSRHGRVLEHATCTWALEFSTRVLTHELVRNATGTTYAQESLRYVRLTDIPYRLPACIAEVPEAVAEFQETMEFLEAKQKRLAEIFQIDQMTDFNRKKVLTSAFRRLAPIGLATGIVATFNFRALRWLCEQRTQVHAEEEIREVLDMIAERSKQRWPYVFQDFYRNSTDEWVPEFSKV